MYIIIKKEWLFNKCGMQLNVWGSFALYNTCANKWINKRKIEKIWEERQERERKKGRKGRGGKANANVGKLSQNHGKLVKYSSLSFLFFSKQKKNHREKKQLGWGSVSLQHLFSTASVPGLDPTVQKTAKENVPNHKSKTDIKAEKNKIDLWTPAH